MFMRATTYKKLTNSIFSTTFLVAVGVVSVGSVLECPANQVSNDNGVENGLQRKRQFLAENQSAKNAKSNSLTGQN